MRDGFIKAAAGTPALRVADCDFNAGEILSLMLQADQQGVKVLCLPELCLTGYTCGDLFLQPTLLRGAEEGLRRILDATRELELVTAVGMPVEYENKLYNCAVIIQKGDILGVVPKTYIPNYGEFYEARWFAPGLPGHRLFTLCGQETFFGTGLLFCCETLPALTIGVEICEDLWAVEPPSCSLVRGGATLILNPSASDEVVGKSEYRRALVKGQSARLVCGYVYANPGEGESTTDVVYGGHNIIAENGAMLAEGRFRAGLTVSEVDVERLCQERRRMNTYHPLPEGQYLTLSFALEEAQTALTRPVSPTPFVPQDEALRQERCEEVLTIAALGLKKRLEHTHAKTAVLGLSGGLDSTLALLITARAMTMLGRSAAHILAVTMPCFGTTQRTRSNAQVMAERMGCAFKTVDITAAVSQHFLDIGQDAGNTDVTYENAQARERTQVLMDLANQTGGMVVGTGDLSELALGWATYNGDHMSMYGVNGSIPKTLVRHLVGYAADTCGDSALSATLRDILDTPVSPELLPAKDGEISQVTEDIVGPYELHDFYLYYAVRWGFPPKKILRLARYAFDGTYNEDTLVKWLKNFYRRFFAQQFKRSCLPDGPKVGSVSLSPRGDWRMPSDAVSALWMAELEEL